MKLLTFLLLGFSLPIMAEDINCVAKKNTEMIWEEVVPVETGKKVRVGTVDEFQIFLNANNKRHFEIEVFDSSTPSRQYASGQLANSEQVLSWTLWSRSILLEVNCKL